jgi:hypothetical protein
VFLRLLLAQADPRAPHQLRRTVDSGECIGELLPLGVRVEFGDLARLVVCEHSPNGGARDRPQDGRAQPL